MIVTFTATHVLMSFELVPTTIVMFGAKLRSTIEELHAPLVIALQSPPTANGFVPCTFTFH